jgi:alkylation response protein AidB-like acyl-CoA dehydrogenase
LKTCGCPKRIGWAKREKGLRSPCGVGQRAVHGSGWGVRVAAGAYGTIRACLEVSVKYYHEREPFGKPIGRHKLVQQMIAKMAENLEIGVEGGLAEEPGEVDDARGVAAMRRGRRRTTRYRPTGRTDIRTRIRWRVTGMRGRQ